MSKIRNMIATSEHPLAKKIKFIYKKFNNPSLPAPKIIVKPLLWGFILVRSTYYELVRIFFCEPLFKAYCKSYGNNLHTTAHLPWIQGGGDIVLGDDVLISGRCAISFASRFSERPLFKVGNHTDISNGSSFVVGKSIIIGNHVLIGPRVNIRDSNGHASDPEKRQQGEPPAIDEVRPVVIEDNVWIGNGVIIGPGVTVGEGSIISASSVVVNDVLPYTVVSGFPARKVGVLKNPNEVAEEA